MTVTRVGATVVFLGLQFLPTITACGRPPYRTVLLAPLTWALALTFSFTAMWECEFDTLSLNLLFGGAAGVFMGGQFGSEYRRKPREWMTRQVGSLWLFLYIVFGSLQGSGRLVRNYGPNICKVASQHTPLEEFAAPREAYAKVGTLAVLLLLASIRGRALLPSRWFSRQPEEPPSTTDDRGASGSPPPSPPPPEIALSFFQNPAAIAAMFFRCLMTGALGATLFGWKLDVDLDDPRNVAFAFATVRTRDWAVLMFAAIVEVVTLSMGVVAFAHHGDETNSWEEYKRNHVPRWSFVGFARSLWCCCGRKQRMEDDSAAMRGDGGDEEAPAPALDSHFCGTQANAVPLGAAAAERLDMQWAHAEAGVHPDTDSRRSRL